MVLNFIGNNDIKNMPAKWISKEKCITLLLNEVYRRFTTCWGD
jgi:hypothetical protein